MKKDILKILTKNIQFNVTPLHRKSQMVKLSNSSDFYGDEQAANEINDLILSKTIDKESFKDRLEFLIRATPCKGVHNKALIQAYGHVIKMLKTSNNENNI